MRTRLRQSSRQSRCTPSLESLEDRRLLSGLLPLLGSDASHSTAAAALPSLVAAPLNVLATDASAVQQLGGSVFSRLAQSVAATPASTPAADPHLNLNLNVDVLFVHLDSVDLNVSVAPLGSTESLVSLGVGGQAGGLLKSVPEVSVGLGGSNLVSLGVGSPNGSPSLPGLPGVVNPPPAGDTIPGVGSVLNDGGGTIQLGSPSEGTSVAAPPAANAIAPPTTTTASTSTSTVLLSGASSSSIPAPVLAVTAPGIADGGAGGVADAPLLDVTLVDGGAGDPITALPVPPVDGAGSNVPVVVAADLAPEASGLATQFQPDGVSRLHQSFGEMAVGPQGGWLSALLARLAPYLAVLILAGVGFDLERRRRLRRAAKAARS